MARTARRFNAIEQEGESPFQVSDKKYSIALYARLSVELKENPSNSIKNQLSIMKAYISDKLQYSQTFEYIDQGASGTTFQRIAFEQMMADAKDGKINCIIVKDLSRFSRSYTDAGRYIENIFPFLGIRFISINDHYDSEDAYNQNKSLEVTLKNLANDMYVKDISKRVSYARRMDMEKGKFVGSNAPYGYTIDGKGTNRKYIIDAKSAMIVKAIFQMALDGISLRGIARELNQQGLSSPGEYLQTKNLHHINAKSAKKWYVGTISNILGNQSYIGNMVQGKRRVSIYENEELWTTDKDKWIVVEGTHEPIIKKEIFEEVRGILEWKKKTSSFNSERGRKLPIEENIFAGIIYCGQCGRKLQRASRIIGKGDNLSRQYFFHCSYGYDLEHKRRCVGSWLEREIMQLVYDELASIIATQNMRELQDGLLKIKKSQSVRLDSEIREKERTIQKIEYENNKRYESYVLGEITKEALQIQSKVNEQKVAEYKRQMVEIKNQKVEMKKILDQEKRWWRAAASLKGKASLEREMVETMIQRIDVYADKTMQITYNFQNSYIEQQW